MLADVFGDEYGFEWEWALADCAIEVIFAGFGPPTGSGPRGPVPDGPPIPRPDAPTPRSPENPRPRPCSLDGEPLETTDDRPFWAVDEGQWSRADELQVGDLLLTSEGSTVAITDDRDQATARTVRAYNLSVEGVHTYFVVAGDAEVLVHNNDTCDLPIKPGTSAGPTAASRSRREPRTTSPPRTSRCDNG